MSTGEQRAYDGLTVFSATTFRNREGLGEHITEWLRAHPQLVPVSTWVRQSSDARFHCLSILIFWRQSSGTGPTADRAG